MDRVRQVLHHLPHGADFVLHQERLVPVAPAYQRERRQTGDLPCSIELGDVRPAEVTFHAIREGKLVADGDPTVSRRSFQPS